MPDGEAAPAPRFEFATAGRIIFGVGVAVGLAEVVASFGSRALLITGRSGPRRPPGFEPVATVPVPHEPTVPLAESGAQLAREHRAEVVVAIGGGSVLDAAKAIAALAANPGGALEYLEVVGRGRPLQEPALPVIAVPTTAGTGAEVTRNAVLAVPDARVKASLRHVSMLPRVAIVDPELTFELPRAQTAASGLDALTQLIEPYLSTRANPLTDALSRDGIPRAARALPVAGREPRNPVARTDLALAALYSGMALANAGLGAVHGFAAPIGGAFSAPHGAVCAALLPHVWRANLAALRARAPGHPVLGRFDEVARWLTGDPNARADDGGAWCERFVTELGIPRLSHWGIREEHIDGLVDKAAAASSMKPNPIPLTPGELRHILASAL